MVWVLNKVVFRSSQCDGDFSPEDSGYGQGTVLDSDTDETCIIGPQDQVM